MLNESNLNGDELLVIKMMKRINNCTIMTKGLRKVEMDYYLCSCDLNQKDPICVECAENCHKTAGHSLSRLFEYTIHQSKQVCACGLKCHQISGNVDKFDEAYQATQCTFHEFGIISKFYTFFNNPEKKLNICVFCANLCLKDEKMWRESDSKNYQKVTANSESEYLPCNCPCPSHKESKIILNYMSNFVKSSFIPGLDFSHNLNLLFKSESTIRYIFKSYLESIESLSKSLLRQDFEFDKKVSSMNIHLFAQNLGDICKSFKKNFYPTDKLKNLINKVTTIKLLENKIPDNQAVFILIKNILLIYQKFSIAPLFENHPNFEVLDFINLTPFQRLAITEEAHKSENFRFVSKETSPNLIDNYIMLFESMVRMRFDKQEGFYVIEIITSFLKKMSSMYLISYDQILKFSSMIDDLFCYITSYNRKIKKKNLSLDFKIKVTEYKIVKNIIQIFLYNSFFYNDVVFMSYLERADENPTIAFLHTNNEFGKLLAKNIIHLASYIRDELGNLKSLDKNKAYRDESNQDLLNDLSRKDVEELEKRKILKKILYLGQNLFTILMHSEDPYLMTMNRCLDTDLEVGIKLVHKNFDSTEKSFYEFVTKTSLEIEILYNRFFNFEIEFSFMQDSLIRLLKSVFDSTGIKNYENFNFDIGNNPDSHTKFQENKNFLQNNQASSSSFNTILSKSNLIFSLLKIFTFNKSHMIKEDYTVMIIKLLHFFIDHHVDNCLIVMSKPFLNSLSKISFKFVGEVFDLYLVAMDTLLNNSFKISHSASFISFIFQLCKKTIDKSNMYSCLLKIMKLLKKIFFVQTIFKNETIPYLRRELKNVSNEYKIFQEYKEYLLNCAKNSEEVCEKSNRSYFSQLNSGNTDYNYLLSNQIFQKFITLMNLVYDENALHDESSHLTKILNSKEILLILKITNLNLNLRTGLIRFFRIVYIDVSIADKKINEYRKTFTRDFENGNILSIDNSFHLDKKYKIFQFLDNLVKISGYNIDSNTSKDEYELLIYELKNISQIIEQSNNMTNTKVCINYLENGIVLPLKVYLTKIFSIATNMTGKDFLKIYTMCYYILQMKKYILNSNFFGSNSYFNNHNDSKERTLTNLATIRKEELRKQPTKSLEKSVIKLDKFNSSELKKIEEDLLKITDIKFKALDYYSLSQLVNKHILSLVNHPTSKELASYFSEYQNYHQDKMGKLKEMLESEGILKNKLTNRLVKLLEDYTYQKKDFENLCIKLNLNEIHMDIEVSFRTLLLKFLFYISANQHHILEDEIFVHEANHIILSLLMGETVPSQSSIKELMEESIENKISNNIDINLVHFAELSFKNILSIIFSQYNPTTLELSNDYYMTCHNIKLFKFLCEEHNSYFQQIFLKQLAFKVGDIHHHHKVYFYDMMLYILDKIIFISNWSKVKGRVKDDEVDFFYALFSCLVEMLIEIIQGTKSENFNLLLKEDNSGTHTKEDHHHSKIPKKEHKPFLSMENKIIINDPVFESGKAFPILLNNIKSLLFNDEAEVNTIYNARKQLVDFLLAFLEEFNCPRHIQMLIMTNYHPQLIFKSICAALKKYYCSLVQGNNVKLNQTDTKNEKSLKEKSYNRLDLSLRDKSDVNFIGNRKTAMILDQSLINKKESRGMNIRFTEDLFKFFTHHYFTEEKFSQSPVFEFCASFYNFFKLTVLQFKFDESVAFWHNINSLTHYQIYEFNKRSNKNTIHPQDGREKPVLDEIDYETYYIIKFFEQICKSVTIKLEEVSEPALIVYTMSPKLNYLSVNSKEKFIRTVNRDNRYTKLYELMEETIYFKLEIEHNWEKTKNSKIMHFAMQLDYYFVAVIMYLCVGAINFILLTTLREAGENTIGGVGVQTAINIFSIIFLIVDLFFIVLWCITKLPLNYKIEHAKYLEKMKIFGKTQENLTNYDKLIILFDRAIIERNELNSFLWNFVCILIGVSSKKLMFFYSLSLMAVVNLSETLNNIILSIVIKKRLLAWTAIFTIICLYFYSAWAFFYNKDRTVEMRGWGTANGEDVCQNLFSCMLFVVNYGFRWKAGIGRWIQRISYFDNPANYIFNKFLFDFSSFMIITIVLKKVLFGIILDTFRELRAKQFKTDMDVSNICFICEIEKDECEKNNDNFKHHCDKVHNIWDYVNYMITLRLKDSQDLNANNSFAKEQLEAKKIGWFPINENECHEESNGHGH